jgi:CheY-like chemotaxis protein
MIYTACGAGKTMRIEGKAMGTKMYLNGFNVCFYIVALILASYYTEIMTMKTTMYGRETKENARIMVVDDEKNIRDLFRTLLSLHLPNARIDVAVNGVEAVDIFQVARTDVIIMDLMMPVMNGEKAFFEIKRMCDENKWKIPSVIFCTGYAPSDMISRIVKEDPMHCIVTKPVSTEKLFSLIMERLAV